MTVATVQGEACNGAEPFALMVLGDSMSPEFENGDIVVIEPEGQAVAGAFVLAYWKDEWIFRRLERAGDEWFLSPLQAGYERLQIPDLEPIRGVIIQKSKPGRRRETKSYLA